jgi:hypothetical protein
MSGSKCFLSGVEGKVHAQDLQLANASLITDRSILILLMLVLIAQEYENQRGVECSDKTER